MKATPKSCSCRACRIGKRSKAGQHQKRMEERAYRHDTKRVLAEALKGKEVDINPAPHGAYND